MLRSASPVCFCSEVRVMVSIGIPPFFSRRNDDRSNKFREMMDDGRPQTAAPEGSRLNAQGLMPDPSSVSGKTDKTDELGKIYQCGGNGMRKMRLGMLG